MSSESDFYNLDRFVARAERDESWKSKCGPVRFSSGSLGLTKPNVMTIADQQVCMFLLDDPGCVLSNSAPTPFTLHGMEFNSVDHYLSFKDAYVVDDVRAVKKIMRHPQHHYQFLKRVDTSEEFDKRRTEMMALVMHEKFRVYPELMETLIANGGGTIYSVSMTDERYGCCFTSDSTFQGLNICGGLLAVIRARELMNRAMTIPLLTYSFLDHRENVEPTAHTMIQTILRDCENITPRFLASFVPKLPFNSDCSLHSHNECFRNHDTHLPVGYGATPFGSAVCIYCKK